MKNPLRPTIICLRISSAIYFLLALVCIMPFFTVSLADQTPAETVILRVIWGMMCLLSVVLGVFVEKVIQALRQGKHWGWIAGLCVAGLYMPSGFMVLGIIMLINLLKDESKEYCKKEPNPVSQPAAAGAAQAER
jgi:hypothetical protein